MYVRNTHCAAGIIIIIIITIATNSIAIVVTTIVTPLPLQLLSIHESSWIFELAGKTLIEKQIGKHICSRVGSVLLKTMKNTRFPLVGTILLEKSSKSKSVTVEE